MKISIDEEFKEICQAIINEDKELEEWKLIEADDYFKSPHYEGGFDATEEAFCFSYYDDSKKEWWFQLTLEEIKIVYLKKIKEIEVRTPNI